MFWNRKRGSRFHPKRDALSYVICLQDGKALKFRYFGIYRVVVGVLWQQCRHLSVSPAWWDVTHPRRSLVDGSG